MYRQIVGNARRAAECRADSGEGGFTVVFGRATLRDQTPFAALSFHHRPADQGAAARRAGGRGGWGRGGAGGPPLPHMALVCRG